MLQVFLIGWTTSGFIFFCIGLYHIVKCAYSFIKNFSFFLKSNSVRKKEGYHWIYCLYDIRHTCLFDGYNDYYKKYLINDLKERLNKYNVKPVSTGDYHDTH